MKQFLPLLFVLILAGCGAAAEDPATSYQNMEQKLLSAQRISFDFSVSAEGVIEGNFVGSAEASADGGLTITSTGDFIGRDLQMELTTDADSMRMVTSEMSDSLPLPPATFEAVVIGLTRMGLLHNLAALSTVSPPDHSDGGITEWVVVQDFEDGDGGVAFSIFVEGDKTSDVTLTIEDGIPVRRRQVVQFPGGEMIVSEEYSNFTVIE